MKTNYIFVNILISINIIIGMSCSNMREDIIVPPKAEKINKELTIHGDTRIDNYYWLKDKENPKVVDYLNAENDYLNNVMKDTEELQEKLYNEIIGRIKQKDQSVPYKENGYWYYVRYEEAKEYPIYCRKKETLEADEVIILNVNDMAEGFNFYKVSGVFISPNNNIIAYGVDTVSRRKYTLYFKSLVTGKVLKKNIPNTSGSLTWANDNKTVFYSKKDEQTLRPNKIYIHDIGSTVNQDKIVFEETDETYNTGVFKTKSQKYIMIVSYATLSTEYRYINADNPHGEFKIFQTREKELEYSVNHYFDKFYIVTNLNGKNNSLMQTPEKSTTKDNWKEVISSREDVYLNYIEIFDDFLVVSERKEGINNLRIINLRNKSEHYLNFGEEVYDADISINPDFDSDILRYTYTSLTTPVSTYEYNMKTKEKKLLKQQEVLGGFSSDNYNSKRLYATAVDGKKIPISIVYRKGIKLNGKSPLLLYGYGSYGITIDPGFSSVRLSLLDRGFVFAIAHVRGGQIKGRKWYDDGKLLNKKNTFTDFIACAEDLINEKYTNSNKLFAYGGSAGGLLMGAVVNMRPDLFKGVIAAVPFVDVVTTMLDKSIPLTTGEYDEWGNPNNKEYYDYMLSYSPYDNVKKQDYLALLVTTGLHDSQVQYWEPAKWVAKLRDMKTDDNILLLHTNMDVGHGGASGRLKAQRETALEYAFLLKLLE